MIGRRNPVNGVWYTRYRGFVEELDYSFDPSQKVNRLTVTLVDLFEMVAAIEMQDTTFSDPTPSRPAGSLGQVFFEDKPMDDRIKDVLGRAGIPVDYFVVFSGNVLLWEAVYSPAEKAMTAIQEAADAEFPGVSNVYVDRLGRLCAHGRLAKFDPAGTAASAGSDSWDFHSWKAGDGAAVHADATHGIAQLRVFAFNRGLAKVINQGFATPTRAAKGVPLTGPETTAQVYTDSTSIGLRGIRSWSAQDLLTKKCLIDGVDDLTETKRFAQYYVVNYAQPRDRVTQLSFRSIRPTHWAGTVTWALLSQIDIADAIALTVASPGGGGFNLEPYFVEGVHEQVQPLNQFYDDVTLSLDLSPQAYFADTTMFPR